MHRVHQGDGIMISTHRLFAIALALAACTSSTDDAAVHRTSCDRLQEHVIELRLDAAAPARDLEQHRAALRAAVGAQVAGTCQEMAVAELQCALAARDLEELAGCEHERRDEAVQ